MGVRTMGYLQRFNKYKGQGLTDSEAAKRAMNEASEETIKARQAEKAAKKKKEQGIISRAAKGIKSVFGPGHSPAGRRHLAGKVRKYGK